jgi:hypothetical protein
MGGERLDADPLPNQQKKRQERLASLSCLFLAVVVYGRRLSATVVYIVVCRLGEVREPRA